MSIEDIVDKYWCKQMTIALSMELEKDIKDIIENYQSELLKAVDNQGSLIAEGLIGDWIKREDIKATITSVFNK